MTLRIAFTRPADKTAESLEIAASMGMEAMAAPSLMAFPADSHEYQEAEEALSSGRIDFAVFGSGTAVEFCSRRWGDAKFVSLFSGIPVVSIGPHTAESLAEHGLKASMMPQDDYSSYGVVSMLSPLAGGKRVMLVRSDSGTDVLRDGLSEAGADVEEFPAYHLKKVGMTPELRAIMDALEAGRLDAVAFTSPMSASSFIEELSAVYGAEKAHAMLSSVGLAAIGRPTAERLAECGHPPQTVPARTTFRDMLEAIMQSEAGKKDGFRHSVRSSMMHSFILFHCPKNNFLPLLSDNYFKYSHIRHSEVTKWPKTSLVRE